MSYVSTDGRRSAPSKGLSLWLVGSPRRWPLLQLSRLQWYNRVDISSPSCHSGPHKSSPSSIFSALNLYNCPLNIKRQSTKRWLWSKPLLHVIKAVPAQCTQCGNDAQIDTTKKNGISLQSIAPNILDNQQSPHRQWGIVKEEAVITSIKSATAVLPKSKLNWF